MGEKSVYSTHAHVFQIDPETKKKWLPTSTVAVRVAYYHDPGRKTYRIIAIESNKRSLNEPQTMSLHLQALVNSTITANMNFTKTSPKFGQWSDHRANTVYGLGFASEKDLNVFVEKFNEAKAAARVLLEERKREVVKAEEQDKPQPPAGTSPSPISPPGKSPPLKSPPVDLLKSPPISSETGKQIDGEGLPRKLSGALVNGGESQLMSKISNGSRESSPALDRSSNASPEAQLEGLKYENSKLKVALASSAQNVKKWESEMQTLKNNNTRLTTALEESTQHVAEWKKQLQKYKEESDLLKKKVQEMEQVRAVASVQASEESEGIRRENEELKEVLSAVQLDLEAKTEELKSKEVGVETLTLQLAQAHAMQQVLEENTHSLRSKVAVLEDQLRLATMGSQRKLTDLQQQHRELGSRLEEVLRLHREMNGHFEA